MCFRDGDIVDNGDNKYGDDEDDAYNYVSSAPIQIHSRTLFIFTYIWYTLNILKQ